MDENGLIRKELIIAIQRAGADASVLSRKIGRSKDYLGDFFRGKKNSIGHAELIKLRELLNIDEDISKNLQSINLIENPKAVDNGYKTPTVLVSEEARIPLFASAQGGEGSLIITDDEIDRVPRPYTLEHVKEAYAILIEGESMDPAFEPGDIAWVNPLLGARRNHDVILFGAFKEGAEPRALIKRIVSFNDDDWTVKQYNPQKQFVLSRTQWGVCHRVVGKLSKR